MLFWQKFREIVRTYNANKKIKIKKYINHYWGNWNGTIWVVKPAGRFSIEFRIYQSILENINKQWFTQWEDKPICWKCGFLE